MSAWLVVVVALAAQGEPAPPPPSGTPADTPAEEKPAEPTPDEETPVEPPPAPATADSPPGDPKTEAPTASTSTSNEPELWVGCPKTAAVCFENDLAAIWPKLRVRAGYELVEADPEILLIGQNDGFFVDQARLGAEGTFRNIVFFKLVLDAATTLPSGKPNQAVNPVFAAARDVWVGFRPTPWLGVTVGHQNMPADYEASDDVVSSLPFARRSVASSGVRVGHGFAVGGLSPSRQIGVVVGSGPDAGFGDIGVQYSFGISNGNGENIAGNDNKLPAGYLRLGGSYDDLIKVGVGGRLNPRTVGELPNLFTEDDLVGFADMAVAAAGFELVAIATLRQTSLSGLVPDPANPLGQETGFGITAWAAYDIGLPRLDMLGGGWNVKPAFRSSFYDPSSAFQTDALLESTIGARLTGQDLPLSVFLDFTLLTELGDVPANVQVRDLANNRLTLLMQLEL